MNKFIVVYVALIVLNKVNCNINLKIQLESFSNPFGVQADKQCCNQNTDLCKCSTFFKFCLRQESQESCMDHFETQIIGENFITNEQFQLTTDSILFNINNNRNNEELYLVIEALNQNQQLNKAELISSWTFKLNITGGVTLNNWKQFKQFNYKLNQQLSFTYQFECANNYYGAKCEQAKCLTGCALSKGGYCDQPNECLCRPGWFGDFCDQSEQIKQETKVCDLNCKNGGKCTIEKGLKVCKCDPALYKGDLCQIRIVHSCGSKCLNGGSCFGNNECLCPPGYAGDKCQTKRLTSQCGTFTCYNGGTCFIDNQNEYGCMCHSAFTGSNCEIRIHSTIQTTPVTTPATTTTTSTISVSSTKESIDSAIESNTAAVNLSNKSLSMKEIILIVIIGVGLPIFAVLVTLLLCQMRRINKQKMFNEDLNEKQVSDVENKKYSKEENIYVECQTEKTNSIDTAKLNQFNKNIFDSSEKSEKEIYINTISANIMKTNQSSDLKLFENNIYSVINYKHDPIANKLKKNFVVQSNNEYTSDSYYMIASIV
jgi:hypothetical protein